MFSSLDYVFYKLTRRRVITVTLFVVCALLWIAVFASANTGELEVYFFDVGQGDAIFLNFPDGRQILIDGGPNDKVVEKLNSTMPFWDRSIDIVVATHADSDHITGLVQVLKHYDVSVIIWNGVSAKTKIFKEWEEAVLAEDTEVLVGQYGMRITLSDASFFEILHPLDSAGSGPAESEQNDLSIVSRLVYGKDTFLFTGDVERGVEYKIASYVANIQSDILKIPHHGSKTSSSELLLERVNPEIAIISVGRNNSYGHPREVILQRLNKYGIKVRRTDLEGDIIVTSDGARY